MNAASTDVSTCPSCGARQNANIEICEFCNTRLSGTPSLFAGRAEKVGFDWREGGLPFVAIIWAVIVGFGGYLIPAFFGLFTLAGSIAVAAIVLAKIDVLTTAAKYICAITALRSLVVLILMRTNFTLALYSLYGLGLVLSIWLAYLIYINEE